MCQLLSGVGGGGWGLLLCALLCYPFLNQYKVKELLREQIKGTFNIIGLVIKKIVATAIYKY